MENKIYKIRLKKGDEVQVISGREKGKSGKILATHPKENKVTVAGLNIVKRHVKPNQTNKTGGIIEVTKPIWVSKVMIKEPTKKTLSKIGYSVSKDGKKIRVYKKTGKEIS